MNRRTLLRMLVAFAASLSLRPRWLLAATAAGSVVAVSGECTIETQGRRAVLRIGDPVGVSDTVDVPANGKLKLRMSDGSIVSVAAGSRMMIASYQTDAAGQRQEARLTLAQGLLRAVVAPVQRPAAFEVSTAVGTAAVRSTDWFIEAQGGSAQVGVLAGSVSLISGATGREVTIPARWGARLEAGRDPVSPRVWAPAEFEAVIARTNI